MSKLDEIDPWIEEAFSPPDADYIWGECTDCDGQVWIDTSVSSADTVGACDHHRPLCDL